MKLKENTTQRKLRGGYYTPQKLADYITKITLKDKKKILEPSCGDGSFLKSIKNILDNNDYNIEKIRDCHTRNHGFRFVICIKPPDILFCISGGLSFAYINL